MNNFNIGDKVEVLDDKISGIIIKIDKDKYIIESAEGFELSFTTNELIKTGTLSAAEMFSNASIQNVLNEKSQVKRKAPPTKKPKERYLPTMEVDLHLHHLVKNERHLTNFDKLNIQLDTAKHKLDYAIKNNIQKIVFIHGVGEGVLKTELEYLFRRYDSIKYYEADYKKYGQGATEIYIFQNKANAN